MKKGADRTWLEINYRAITNNIRTLRTLITGETMLMAVVKSNAYGHGIVASARAAILGGVTWLGVDEISEALVLRKEGIKVPILVLGYTLPEWYKTAAVKNISLTVSSLDVLQDISGMSFTKPLKIHIKFDTGLHRQGIMESHIQQSIRIISRASFPAVIEGMYTHFATMEDPLREDYSRMQRDTFKQIITLFALKKITPITHAGASSALLFSKEFHFDMVRVGIATYGLWPSREIKRWAKDTALVPALTWKTIVGEVKLVQKGARVGYDLTHELSRNSRLAIIPVGYWHGLPRALSNTGSVLIGGKKVPIVGRVSMDMTIVDVTDSPRVTIGSEVVIIGNQGAESITADEVAQKAGTINYELVTRINPLIPRISV